MVDSKKFRVVVQEVVHNAVTARVEVVVDIVPAVDSEVTAAEEVAVVADSGVRAVVASVAVLVVRALLPTELPLLSAHRLMRTSRRVDAKKSDATLYLQHTGTRLSTRTNAFPGQEKK